MRTLITASLLGLMATNCQAITYSIDNNSVYINAFTICRDPTVAPGIKTGSKYLTASSTTQTLTRSGSSNSAHSNAIITQFSREKAGFIGGKWSCQSYHSIIPEIRNANGNETCDAGATQNSNLDLDPTGEGQVTLVAKVVVATPEDDFLDGATSLEARIREHSGISFFRVQAFFVSPGGGFPEGKWEIFVNGGFVQNIVGSGQYTDDDPGVPILNGDVPEMTTEALITGGYPTQQPGTSAGKLKSYRCQALTWIN